MGVFKFGDPANRRPAWIEATMPKPRSAGRGGKAEYRAAANPAESIATATGSGARVLVADDNPVNRMLASEMLASWGVDLLQAADGSQAVELAREFSLALILMDLQMPVLDGLEATRRIRRLELERARPCVPIIAYTSAGPGTDPLLLNHLGFDGALVKPCTADEMRLCLLRWCAGATVARRAHTQHDPARTGLLARERPNTKPRGRP